MSTDKTSLEREIEERELSRSNSFLYLVIFLLLISSIVLGAYAFKLTKELNAQDNKFSYIQKKLDDEIISLRQHIEQLQSENEALKSKIQELTPPSKINKKMKSQLHSENITIAIRELFFSRCDNRSIPDFSLSSE